MILKCPDCGSTNIDQYRMLTGAIWCSDCYYTASHKEVYNPFFVETENDVRVVPEFYEKMEKNQTDVPDEFNKIVDDNFWDLI